MAKIAELNLAEGLRAMRLETEAVVAALRQAETDVAALDDLDAVDLSAESALTRFGADLGQLLVKVQQRHREIGGRIQYGIAFAHTEREAAQRRRMEEQQRREREEAALAEKRARARELRELLALAEADEAGAPTPVEV